MTALPPIIASTSPSGHTVVQVAQPMHWALSMCGCCDFGPSEYTLPFSAAACARASRCFNFFRYPRRNSQQMTPAIASVISVSIRVCLQIAHHHDKYDMEDGQHGKRVAEWFVDDMPEMEH